MNRKRTLFYAAIVFATALLLPFITHVTHAGVLYYSANNQTVYNDPAWFVPGMYDGDVYSSDYFYFQWPGDTITGYISTSQDSFRFRNISLEDLTLYHPPIFNAPYVPFYNNMESLVRQARVTISDEDGSLMTRMLLLDSQYKIYQYPLGLPYDEARADLVREGYFDYWGWRNFIFIDGQLEIEGVWDAGATIGASGDIWLIGDVRYQGADEITGWFDENQMDAILGLETEGDIIIANSVANGRGNSWNDGADLADTDHHSIIINAALSIPNGSFRFENPNDDDDLYQGPEPDERGIIHLKGAIAQYRAFQLHNDNHGGTGYKIDFHYDSRLQEWRGQYWYIYIDLPGICRLDGYRLGYYIYNGFGFVVADATCDWLSAYGSAELQFIRPSVVEVYNGLRLGSPQSLPVKVTFPGWSPGDSTGKLLTAFMHSAPSVHLFNTMVDAGVKLHFEADSILIDSCSFADNVYLEASFVSVRNSVFKDTVTLAAWDFGTFERNVVQGMLVVDRRPRCDTIRHNTIVNPGGDGVLFENYDRVEFRNNIVAFCRRGVVNAHWQEPTLEYNDVYGNGEDYVDCEPGEGSISADPRFVNPDSGDFHLEWNSPCIDAGDPDSPEDPDGTRADIGAFYFDALSEPSSFIPHPSSFTLSISPNPFNHQATIRYRTPKTAEVEVMIFNLRGERVAEIFKGLLIAGQYSAVWDASNQPAGVYLCRILAGGRCGVVKVVLLK